MFRVSYGSRNQGLELGLLLRRRIATLKPGSTFELVDEREESTVGMMRRAEIAQGGVRHILDLVPEREGDVRLADAPAGQEADRRLSYGMSRQR
jgi:hypothetical protein